jgi:hypothetical protein
VKLAEGAVHVPDRREDATTKLHEESLPGHRYPIAAVVANSDGTAHLPEISGAVQVPQRREISVGSIVG